MHLFAWLVAAPSPLPTIAPIDITRAAHNLEIAAGQVGLAALSIVLIFGGVMCAIKGKALGAVSLFAMAVPCAVFVVSPETVIGVVQSLVATIKA